MAKQLWIACVVTLALAATRSIGAAQDMTFGLEETGGGAAGDSAPPSPVFVRGHEAYAHKRYAAAAVQLHQVVSGDTDDGSARVRQAQLTLGKALVHLGFDESALRTFDAMTAVGGDHPHSLDTLGWLATLAARAADRSAIAAVVDRFQPDALPPQLSPAVRDELLLLMGRHAYERRSLPRAIEILRQVGTGTPRYVQAQLLMGISHVRARHARPAIAAFREVLRALASGDAGDVRDRRQLEDLAWLSLGRVYYTAAHRRGESEEHGALLGSAVDAWSRVSEGGHYWLDALFESSWALFVSDQHARALGNLHGLLSPYFKGAFHPEAYVIKAVTLYHSCQMDNATSVIRDFHSRHTQLHEELAALPARMEGDNALLLTEELAEGRLQASNDLRSLLARTLGARDVRSALEQIDAFDAQRALLHAADPELRDSALGMRIAEDLQLATASARERASTLVRAKVTRLIAELQDISNQIDAIEIEILKWRRDTLESPPVAPREGGGEVRVDSEHVVWPFNGEYWRDELPYYRQKVENRCAR